MVDTAFALGNFIKINLLVILKVISLSSMYLDMFFYILICS